MNIHHWHRGFRLEGESGCVVGNFDGVHLGHQQMLACLREVCGVRELNPVAVSFYPHPRGVVSGQSPALLSVLRDRAFWLAEYGVRDWVLIPFSRSFMQTAPAVFVQRYLVDSLNTRFVLVGEDFRFGFRGAGTVDTLSALGAQCGVVAEAMPTVCSVDGERISSSRIRRALVEHDLAAAVRLLGHSITFTGRVRHGEGRGRVLNARTANLHVPHQWCLPDGVYVVKLRTFFPDVETWGVANLGNAPTFDISRRRLEVHAFADLGDIYGQCVQVSFYQWLRGVVKFPDAAALQQQIQLDIQSTRAFIATQV